MDGRLMKQNGKRRPPNFLSNQLKRRTNTTPNASTKTFSIVISGYPFLVMSALSGFSTVSSTIFAKSSNYRTRRQSGFLWKLTSVCLFPFSRIKLHRRLLPHISSALRTCRWLLKDVVGVCRMTASGKVEKDLKVKL